MPETRKEQRRRLAEWERLQKRLDAMPTNLPKSKKQRRRFAGLVQALSRKKKDGVWGKVD